MLWSILVLGATALAAAPTRTADAAAAKAAVAALYKAHFAKGQRWDITFERERARFAAPLLRLLDEDSAAQAATPAEVVGLDFDPLTYSQEGADRFVVGNARLEGSDALVPVEIRLGESRNTLTVRLALVDNRWKVANIHDARGDLVTTLKKLKAER